MKSEGIRVPNLASAVKNLGNVVLEQGRHADAETLVRESLDLFGEMTQPKGTILAGTEGLLADCLLARGAFVEAEQLLLQSVDDLQRVPSPTLDINSMRRRTVIGSFRSIVHGMPPSPPTATTCNKPSGTRNSSHSRTR